MSEFFSGLGEWLLAFLNTPLGEKLLMAAIVGIAGFVYNSVSSKWQRVMCWVYEFINLAEKHGASGDRWTYFWGLFKERYKKVYGKFPSVGLESKINNTVAAITAARDLSLTSLPSVGVSRPGE